MIISAVVHTHDLQPEALAIVIGCLGILCLIVLITLIS